MYMLLFFMMFYLIKIKFKKNFFKNKNNFIIYLMFLMTTMSMFFSNIIQIWLLMEINTLLMILMMSLNFNNKNNSILYFIIQTLSSLIMIFSLLMKMNFNNLMIDLMIMLTFSFKLNLFPFFFWMPWINMNLNWILIFIMSTTQKFIPMLLLNSLINQYLSKFFIYWIYITIILSSMFSTILSINEFNLKKIFTFSSINHLSWMLFIILIDQSMFYMYFLFYLMSMIFICYFMNMLNLNFINQMIKILIFKFKLMNLMFSLNILIISSIPPFFTFIIKMNSIKIIISNNNYLMILMFSVISMFTLIFYMNLIIKINILFILMNKFNLNMKNFKNNLILSSILPTILSLLIFWLLFINMF